jgi:glutathione S-transferase
MSPQSAAAWERVIRSFDNGPPFAERPRPTAESWQNLRGSFTRFAQQYEGHKYRFGDHITYADLVIAALLLALDGSATKEQRAEFRTWDDGRWAALIEEVQGAGYTATDHGEFYVAQP